MTAWEQAAEGLIPCLLVNSQTRKYVGVIYLPATPQQGEWLHFRPNAPPAHFGRQWQVDEVMYYQLPYSPDGPPMLTTLVVACPYRSLSALDISGLPTSWGDV